MSSTTTIRLRDDLKARIAAATERQREFEALADERYSRVAASGKMVTWSEMRVYLEQRAAGAQPPAARSPQTSIRRT